MESFTAHQMGSWLALPPEEAMARGQMLAEKSLMVKGIRICY
jgi:hypothetical protein